MSTSVVPVSEPSNIYKYAIVAALCIGGVPLMAMPGYRWIGWVVLGLVAIVLALSMRSRFSQHMLILVGGLSILGAVPINTDISYGHFTIMGVALLLTIVVPYLLSNKVLKDKVVTFPLRFGRPWRRREIAYVIFAGVASYLFLPFYLADTGSYQNWAAVLEPSYIIRLFIGTNALGIWDELFFVGVCLALLRQHVPFLVANLAQAALWTTFLFELGFRGWGPLVIFPFALSQGYIFKRSKSLFYIITVHLTIDFVLFLTLVHLHNPDQLRIFLTSPF